ncbi:MAG: glycogen/starch synthase [Bacteroidetes bacterium]|nr:glycogen/starch synthase [Bacteroidota bacterium]
MTKKRILFITQEMNPYLALTEMGKIVRQLPQYVQENGIEIRVLMPRFGNINERRNRLHEVVRLSGMNIIIDDEDFPLIIKVASLPGARIQVYFLDNEEFFKRKFVFRDDKEKFYKDNAERAIFFCKGALETVKKFGWPPDVIHCHGWMTSLIPLYLKTIHKGDPVFAESSTIFSVYNSDFEGTLSKSFLTKSLINDTVTEEHMKPYGSCSCEDLQKGGLYYSDAGIAGEYDIDLLDEYKSIDPDKKWLELDGSEDIMAKYLEFYKMLMN